MRGPVDEPVAVRLRRGEALPPGTRSIARPSRWGNPFRGPTTPTGRAASVARYREWLAGEHPEVRARGGLTGSSAGTSPATARSTAARATATCSSRSPAKGRSEPAADRSLTAPGSASS